MVRTMTPVSAPAGNFARIAARGSIAFALLALLSLAALHIVYPALAPASSMISQYAEAPSGWLINLCFGSFAAGSFCLLCALVGQPKSIVGWIGLVCLLMAGVGLTFGAIFDMDPVTADPANMSFSGRMHGLAFMIGVPGELLAVLLLSIAFSRAPWNTKALMALAALVWISLVVMAVNLMSWMQSGSTGPAIFGIPNRTFMIGYALWLIVAAWPIARVSRRQPAVRDATDAS